MSWSACSNLGRAIQQLNFVVLRRAMVRLSDDLARFEPLFLSVLVDNIVQGVLRRISGARLQAHIIVAELGLLRVQSRDLWNGLGELLLRAWIIRFQVRHLTQAGLSIVAAQFALVIRCLPPSEVRRP